jgi:hypothetical protein
MKLPNIVGGEANNSSVLAADAMLACELKNNRLTHWQYCSSKIASSYDVLPMNVGTKRHQRAAFLNAAFQERNLRLSNPPRTIIGRPPQATRQCAGLS